ncbi:hypothetical protein BGZ63DRAFT_173395 [Mariannaea sp. PMI_226]|nr:hypothetical protein BGZ63DRAFT_173395 [Mariannaea sp. PMI_226]
MCADTWSSDDASESQPHDFSDSDGDHFQRATLARKSQLRPAGIGLSFVPYADWRPGLAYDEELPDYIRYDVEWKLSLNNRSRGGESEPGVVISPKDFWNHTLQSKLRDAVERGSKPWRPVDTKIIYTVDDRKTKPITKRYGKLKVKWSEVAKQLQDWSHFLRDSKKLSVQITFYYEPESDKTATATRGTAAQVAENNAQVNAELTVLGRDDSWRRVVALVRCPGPPCNKGPYCWQKGPKHYKLLSHHLKILVDETQKGHNMQTHDDLPERVRTQLEAEEEQQAERSRKRRRDEAGSSYAAGAPAIHIHNAPGDANAVYTGSYIPSSPSIIFPTSPAFDFEESRDNVVKAYVEWQQSKVSSQKLKSSYSLIEVLTLDYGLSLEMIFANQKRYFKFFLNHGVLEGVAWHFVCNIKRYYELMVI